MIAKPGARLGRAWRRGGHGGSFPFAAAPQARFGFPIRRRIYRYPHGEIPGDQEDEDGTFKRSFQPGLMFVERALCGPAEDRLSTLPLEPGPFLAATLP